MSNNRFTELLNLYLENHATDSERDELMRMIRAGNHDEMIKDRIGKVLASDSDAQEVMDPQHADKVLGQIFATAREDEKVFPMRSVSRSWRWAAAAAVSLIAISAGWWISRTGVESPQQIAIEETASPSVVHSGKQFVRLPDGSTALLNENSRLSYAASFGATGREVTLVGEAYFDVQHDPAKQFKVLTGGVTTTVLGTAFNVKAYPDEAEIKVTVIRGKVNVDGGQHAFGTITRDQQIAVNTVTNDFVRTNVNAGKAVTWQHQYLILDDVSLEEAVKTIGEKYKVTITLANEQLKMCRISATFLNGENIDQVLTVVCGVVHSTYDKFSDGSVRIDGNGCN